MRARVSRGHDPVELFDALRQECDRHAVVCSGSRVVVPNAYDVELDEEAHRQLDAYPGELGEDLTDVLIRHGENKGYEWAGPLTVHVGKCSKARNGRYRVAGIVRQNIRAETFTRIHETTAGRAVAGRS